MIDHKKLFELVDQKRVNENLSFRALHDLLGISNSTFTRLKQGHQVSVDTFMILVKWLGMAELDLYSPKVSKADDKQTDLDDGQDNSMYVKKEVKYKEAKEKGIKRVCTCKLKAYVVEKTLPNGNRCAHIKVCRVDRTSGITWDQMQAIKQEMGYGNHTAIEIMPKEEDLLYLQNIRHMFVLDNETSDLLPNLARTCQEDCGIIKIVSCGGCKLSTLQKV